MVDTLKTVKNNLVAAIDGLEEMEAKTGDIPEQMKVKLGMKDEDVPDDSPEEMKRYLGEVLDSALSSDMRTWDFIANTNQVILDPR